jgi:hypothetical protein
MSIEAMKQALEALETLNSGDSYKTHNAATALRQAIAEAEKQEAVAWMWKDGTLTSDPDFADGTWTPLFAAPVHASDMSEEHVHKSDKDQLVPDGMIPISNGGIATSTPTDFFAPPKREWVGLDPETMRNTTLQFNQGALWAERYLKEKNT